MNLPPHATKSAHSFTSVPHMIRRGPPAVRDAGSPRHAVHATVETVGAASISQTDVFLTMYEYSIHLYTCMVPKDVSPGPDRGPGPATTFRMRRHARTAASCQDCGVHTRIRVCKKTLAIQSIEFGIWGPWLPALSDPKRIRLQWAERNQHRSAGYRAACLRL